MAISGIAKECLDQLPAQIQKKIKAYSDAHTTCDISTGGSIVHVWATESGLSDKLFWELTQLTKMLEFENRKTEVSN